MKKKLWLLLLLAFAVRLIALNQSLWLDEGTTAWVIQHYTIFQIITQFSPSDFHPPLFYVFEKAWTSIFGYSEVELRMPSVLFSLLTGWILYLIGKLLKNEKTGLFAAALFVFNPLIIYYSQEARMYAMVVCFLAGATYFLFLILKKYTQRDALYFNIFIFLSFMTFYGSIFYIVTLYFVLFIKKRKNILPLIPGFAAALVLLSPLLFQQVLHSHQSLAMVANWKAVLGQVNLKNFILIPIKFVTGRVSFEPKMLYYLIAGVWTVTVFFFFGKGGQKNKVLGILLVLPLILGVIASFVSPLLEYFRFIYLIIPLSVGIAIAVETYWQKVGILFGLLVFSGVYLFFPQFYREDWKSMAASLPVQTVYAIPSSLDAFRYYTPQTKINDLRSFSSQEKTIVVIPYTSDIYGLDYKAILAKNGYTLKKTTSFRGVWYELWRKS